MDNKLNSQGVMLKETREAKGITLEVVHENTKIPLDALRALEEGYSIRTMTPFYQKGFLKMYAQYLDLDVNEILRSYDYRLLNQPKSGVSYPPPLRANFNQERVKDKENQKEFSSRKPKQKEEQREEEPEEPIVPIISRAQQKATVNRIEDIKEKKEPQPLPQRQLFEEKPKAQSKPKPPRETISHKKDFLTPERMGLVVKFIVFLIVVFVAVKVFGWIGHFMASHHSKPKAKVVQNKSLPSKKK